MKIEPRTLKGFRDFLPGEARKRQYVINTLKRVFESYGFEPLETPALEYAQILTGKYGDEGDKLMYRFKDNGDRDVALRYDQTVPLARVVAEYKDKFPMPFKRYQIQNVWRAENTQKGRYREFLQCDIDTVGSESINADVEIIKIVLDCYRELGFKSYLLEINDRSNFRNLEPKYISTIDKLKKIGTDGVVSELITKGMEEDAAKKLVESLLLKDAPSELISLFSMLDSAGIKESKDFEYSPSLARGLDYYTGYIFELTIANYENSLGGGGRYNELIGMFSGESIPAVGFSFGFDRIIEAMDELDLFPKDLFTSKVLVLNLFDSGSDAIKLAGELRSNGINTEVYLDPNIEKAKQFAYAEKKNIPYTVAVDENDTYTLGWKDENGKIIKSESLNFDNLLEQLRK